MVYIHICSSSHSCLFSFHFLQAGERVGRCDRGLRSSKQMTFLRLSFPSLLRTSWFLPHSSSMCLPSTKSSVTLAQFCGSHRSALRISVQRWPARSNAHCWQRPTSPCSKLFSERRTLPTPHLVPLTWRTLSTPLCILWMVWPGQRWYGHTVRVTRSTDTFFLSRRVRIIPMNRWRAKSKFSSFWWTSFWRPTLPGRS